MLPTCHSREVVDVKSEVCVIGKCGLPIGTPFLATVNRHSKVYSSLTSDSGSSTTLTTLPLSQVCVSSQVVARIAYDSNPFTSFPSLMISMGRVPNATSSLSASIPN